MRCRRNDHGRLVGRQSLADEAGDGAGERRTVFVETDGVEQQRPADGRHEFRQHLPLSHHRRSAQRGRGAGDGRVVVRGGKDDSGRVRQFPDEGAGLESVEAGHRDVQDHQIGM